MKTTKWIAGLLLVIIGLSVPKRGFAQPPMPTLPAGELLDAWDFSGTNFLSLRYSAPTSLTNVFLVPTWAGNGLQVDDTNAAWITYAVVEPSGKTNLDLAQGTLETWFSPDWNSSDGIGNWGTLLQVGAWNTNLSAATGAWGLYISSDASMLYFSAQTNGMFTNYLNAPIAWYAGDWHQIVVTYSATNSALYLEGAFVTSGPGISVIPGAEVLSNGFSIGSDASTGLLQSRGVFNNLAIFNYPLDADTISNDYAYDSQNVFPLPATGFGFGGFHPDGGPSNPGGAGGGGGTFGPDYITPSYTTNDFYLEVLPLGVNAYTTNANYLTILLENTTADIEYQLLSTTNLNPPVVWTVEQILIGSETTNFTPAIVYMPGHPTLFFKALAYTLDSDDSGLPDWWQLKYFGYVGVDPYADPMGDGYDNLYKFQHGMNPNIYYTPSAPTVSAILNTNGNIVVSWSAAANLPANGAGVVTGYTLEINDPNDGTNYINFATNQLEYATQVAPYTSLSDYLEFPNYDPPPTCALKINYANGSSQYSSFIPSFDPTCTVNAAVIRGPQGSLYLAVSSVPANVGAIRIMSSGGGLLYPLNFYGYLYYYIFGDLEFLNENIISQPGWVCDYFDIPLSSISNGLYQIPPSQAPLFSAFSLVAMGVGKNGNLGTPVQASPAYDWGSWWVSEYYASLNLNVPFLDGRTNIQQNINMLLRGAGVQNPFNLYLLRADPDVGFICDYAFSQPTNYVSDGFSDISEGDTFSPYQQDVPIYQRNEFEPFEESSLFTNMIFNLDLFDSSGNFNNQLAVNEFSNGDIDLNDPTKLFDAYLYASNNAAYPLSPLPLPALSDATEAWICSQQNYVQGTGPYYLGCLQWNGGNSWTLPIGTRNIYGLPILSVKYFGADANWDTVGQATAFNMAGQNFFQYVPIPILYPAGYYFARPQIDPVPGQGTFSVTNTSPPPFIIPFGQEFYLTAWAKQLVLNSTRTVYAYPQQYFDKAYLADANGNITTNQTGILSEYGDFFPTEPGKVFLTTLPDAATGTVGTNAVNVIKLQLDVNHDGTMDSSFAGPDNTSPQRPFRFWINNDTDIPGEEGLDEDVDMPDNPNYSTGIINCERDLEDFARLWIVGLPALQASGDYEVTLSWTNIVSGNPSIELFNSVETNGGIGYLTDTNVAAAQTQFLPIIEEYNPTTHGAATSIGTVSNTFTFPAGYFTSSGTKYLLFEGASTGNGQLVFTISQSGTNVASTSAFIDLHDIKDFYDRAYTTNFDSAPPSSKVSTFAMENTIEPDPTGDTNMIVFIHGLNTSDFAYYNDGETMFKRLYWQGYRGQYSTFRWPSPVFSAIPANTNQISYLGFNTGEFISWHSGAALKGYLDSLTNRFLGYKINVAVHSLGNACANEAIREGAHVDNYALMQAAMSAWAFDGNNTNLIYNYLASTASSSPDTNSLGGYRNCFTNAPRRVNFYNDDDFALYRAVILGATIHTWEANQLDYKPDTFVYIGGVNYKYSFDGTNCFYSLMSSSGTVLSSRTLTDDFEKKSYVARSRTKAVGAAGLKYTPNALTGGQIAANVSLQDTTLGFVADAQFGPTRPDHSGEFSKTIQNAIPFYTQLLQQGFKITPAP